MVDGRCYFEIVPFFRSHLSELKHRNHSYGAQQNPDGSYLGNLRRSQSQPGMGRSKFDRSPEVFCVRYAMEQTGVDLCIDVHGDEGLPYNFLFQQNPFYQTSKFKFKF